MSKIGVVIQREYTSRVRKKSFLLLTFLMPLLFAGLVFVPLYLSSFKDKEAKTIVVVDETGKYFSALQSSDQYKFIEGGEQFKEFRNKSDETIYATLVISKDLLQDPAGITLYSNKQVTADLERSISKQLDERLSNEKLDSYQIPDLKKIVEDSKVSIRLQTIKWDEAGNEQASSAGLASAIGIAFTLIIYMFIFAYGGMVMQGVLEEKTNRIVEVMISSVKPFDLMMGKIIGIGLVGLTQFFLWSLLIGLINIAGSSVLLLFQGPEIAGAATTTSSINPAAIQDAFNAFNSINLIEISGYFIVFFIGGFMIYASLFAAIGSMVNSQEDTQQYMMPIMVLVLFAFYTGIYSLENPDGPLAFWTSIIPFTSPIVMMVRLPFGVPLWQTILSISILYITVILMVKLSSKIYRVGILMYGKKPTMKEIIKWMKY